MKIGERLKEARMQSGLTQEKVSEEIQVSRQTISNWENEKSYPDIISVIRLSNFYNVSLDELLKNDDGMIEYLDKSTNTVKSNRKLSIIAVISLAVIAIILILIGDRSNVLIWVTVLLEFALLCIVDFSDAPEAGNPAKIVSRVLMAFCIVLYLGLLVICGLAAYDSFKSGQAEAGIKLLITIIVVAVCIYALFIRKFIKILTKKA